MSAAAGLRQDFLTEASAGYMPKPPNLATGFNPYLSPKRKSAGVVLLTATESDKATNLYTQVSTEAVINPNMLMCSVLLFCLRYFISAQDEVRVNFISFTRLFHLFGPILLLA